MVNKTIIEYHQCNKSCTFPHFTDKTVLAEQTQETDKDTTQTHCQENEEAQIQDERC